MTVGTMRDQAKSVAERAADLSLVTRAIDRMTAAMARLAEGDSRTHRAADGLHGLGSAAALAGTLAQRSTIQMALYNKALLTQRTVMSATAQAADAASRRLADAGKNLLSMNTRRSYLEDPDPRSLNADISKRRAAERRLDDDPGQSRRVARGKSEHTLAWDSRGEPSPLGQREMRQVRRRTLGYERDAAEKQVEENYRAGGGALARRRMRHDHTVSSSQRISDADLMHKQQHSRYANLEEQALEMADLFDQQTRMELGGSGQGTGHTPEKVAELQKRQQSAYDALIGRAMNKRLRDAQRLAEFNKRLEAYEASPAGRAARDREQELNLQTHQSDLRQNARQSIEQQELLNRAAGQRRAYEASPEGQQAKSRYEQLVQQGMAGQVQDEYQGQADQLKRVIAYQKQHLDYLRTPAGRAAAREQANLTKESARQAERLAYAQRAASHGHMTAGLEYAGNQLGKVQQEFRAMADAGTAAFAAITAGSLGLASIADPFVTWPTFTASLKALGIEIGAVLLPTINALSARLQGAAAWVNSLSEGTKRSAAQWFVWIGAGGLVVSTIYRIVAAARALTLALGGVRAGLATIGFGAIGVVGALAGEYLLLGQNASLAAQQVGQLGEAALGVRSPNAKKADSSITASQINEVPEPFRSLLKKHSGDVGAMHTVLEAWNDQAAKELANAKPKQIPNLAQRQELDERVNRALQRTTYPEMERTRQFQEDVLKDRRMHDRQGGGGLASSVRSVYNASPLPGLFGQARPEEWEESAVERRARQLRQMNRQVENLMPDAIKDLSRSGIKVFDDKGMPEAQIIERREAGEVSRSELAERLRIGFIQPDKQFPEDKGRSFGPITDYRQYEAQRTSAFTDKEFARMEQQQKLAETMMRNSGFDPAKGGMDFAFNFPTKPQILDPAQYGDKLTIAGLKGDDLEAQNLKRQLELAEQSLQGNNRRDGILVEIREALNKLANEPIGPQRR